MIEHQASVVIHEALAAEQAVLGALLIENSSLDSVTEVLEPSDFYHDAHRVVYENILKLMKNGTPADIVTVSDSIDNNGQLEAIGGISAIACLAEGVPSAANVIRYAEIVLEKSTLRKITSLSTEIHQSTQKSVSSNELIELIQKETQKLAERKNSLEQGFKDFNKLLRNNIDFLQEMNASIKEFNGVSGLSTGLEDLDKITSGLQSGDLIIVAGRPSMGKTALAMSIGEHSALKSKKHVAVFSMEMEAESLSKRMLGSVAKIDSEKMRNANFEFNDWEKISNAMGKLNDAPIHIDETPALSVAQLSARAKKLKSKVGDLGLIIVDYIQLMSCGSNKKNDTRANEVSEITRGLKSLAKELKCPIIALSQLNRELEKRPNKRPQMSDLRESGAIEQDADLILFIYRDEVYNKDTTQDKGIAEIIIGKQRNGRTGTIRTAFIGEYTRFENLQSYGSGYN